jgi:hypothetical protein
MCEGSGERASLSAIKVENQQIQTSYTKAPKNGCFFVFIHPKKKADLGKAGLPHCTRTNPGFTTMSGQRNGNENF